MGVGVLIASGTVVVPSDDILDNVLPAQADLAHGLRTFELCEIFTGPKLALYLMLRCLVDLWRVWGQREGGRAEIIAVIVAVIKVVIGPIVGILFPIEVDPLFILMLLIISLIHLNPFSAIGATLGLKITLVVIGVIVLVLLEVVLTERVAVFLLLLSLFDSASHVDVDVGTSLLECLNHFHPFFIGLIEALGEAIPGEVLHEAGGFHVQELTEGARTGGLVGEVD